MIVKSLELDFFRNYVHLEAVFDPRVNLIYGDNAQGKTNLLEAVAYLSTARSHRARYDREMIMLGVDGAFVKGEVRSRARDFTLEARLNRGARRQLWSNGVRLKTAGELSGILNTVLFCPEDLYHSASITASMTTRCAYSGTGRRTCPCCPPWTTSISAWPRPGR